MCTSRPRSCSTKTARPCGSPARPRTSRSASRPRTRSDSWRITTVSPACPTGRCSWSGRTRPWPQSRDRAEVETLLKSADSAMYHAKDAGRGTYQFYSKSMNAAAFQRLALENALRKALEREEFMLYFQPQVDVSTGAIFGVEALIRWKH